MFAEQSYVGRHCHAKTFEFTAENEVSPYPDHPNETAGTNSKEEWKPIIGYESLYHISSIGRIRKVSGSGFKILSPWQNHRGILLIEFVVAGTTKAFSVHRLVAQAFLNAVTATHLDGNKLNNKVSNLIAPDKSLAKGCPKRVRVYNVVTLNSEEWRSVPGYEDLYQVSSHGRVKRLAQKSGLGQLKEMLLITRVNSNGYEDAALRKGSRTKGFRVHRLVAMAFIPNPHGLPEVNHIDGIKLNNHVSNLEWITRSDNAIHALQMGLVPGKTTRLNRSSLSSLLPDEKSTS